MLGGMYVHVWEWLYFDLWLYMFEIIYYSIISTEWNFNYWVLY